MRRFFTPRWWKLWRDLLAERGRVALMLAAVAVSLSAVGTVLGGYAILTREISVNYLGTLPADVTLEIPGGIDAELLANVRGDPAVLTAEARDVVLARVHVGDDWRPLLLFVVDDFEHMGLNRFYPESGAWPPAAGSVLLERSSLVVLGEADSVEIKLPGVPARLVPVTGLTHDPGLSPAWQEREGYAYLTPATLGSLGGDPALHELRVTFRGELSDVPTIQARAAELAGRLLAGGTDVHQIRIPTPHQHPHQRQMTTILVLLLVFAGMSLVLSAILVANSLAAMLARQVREIGVMKTVGATAGQVAGLYAVLVGGLGVAASLLAWPLSSFASRMLAGEISGMLNFNLTSSSLPWWVPAAVFASGVGVPLLLASFPIRQASIGTVREALDNHGARPLWGARWLSRLPPVVRGALRRPARLALTLGLLAAGGAMYLSAMDVSESWELNTAKVSLTRHYDVDVRLHAPTDIALAQTLRAVPGVRQVEAWGFATGAVERAGGVDVVHTWPDRGHGSLTVFGAPPETRLIDFPVLDGRWLRSDDTDAVVLSHGAAAQVPGVAVGDRLTLSLDGEPSDWTVVGIVEEIGSPGAAYLTDEAFARVTGSEGRARLLRVVTTQGDAAGREAEVRVLETALARADVPVDVVIPLSELDAAVGEHVQILIQSLLGLAAVMATVGALGLTSSMGTAVLERTRELGVLKALGATPERVMRTLLAEALVVASASWVLAVGLGVVLTGLLDVIIGNLGFLAPLPFTLAPAPVFLWLGGVLVLALVATALPARRASRMTVREALAEV